MLLSAPVSFSKPTTDKAVSKNVTPGQLAVILKQTGFKEAEIPTMIAISRAESGLNPKAHNPRYPDDSYGLFQINMLDEPGYKLGEERRQRYGLKTNEELKNPNINARAALDIRNRQGLSAWSVYTSGAYKQYLPEAQKAAQSVLSGATPAMDIASQQPVTPPPPVDQEPKKNKATVDTVLRDQYGIKEEANKQAERRNKALDFLRSRIATNQKDLLGSSENRLDRQREGLMDALLAASKPQDFFE